MLKNGEKLGAFIVPTGVGASVGGFAGDASGWARRFSEHCRLIVNPNVVNAGGFSGINDKMFYVEGCSLNRFFKGEICLIPSKEPSEYTSSHTLAVRHTKKNKIGVVFDKAIPQDVLNVHINTINAVKTVYGVDVIGYEITQNEVGIEFSIEESGISTGSVKNIDELLLSSKKLLARGADAIALVCMFDDPESVNSNYAHGIGVDPIGGVEAILSHYISRELKVPCAHSPAFRDYAICPCLVDTKAASEYITPTFLPCVLLGLDKAPRFAGAGGITVDELDFLIMPYDSLGSTPVFEAVKRGITVYAVKENTTVLNVTAESLGLAGKIIEVASYSVLYDMYSTSSPHRGAGQAAST